MNQCFLVTPWNLPWNIHLLFFLQLTLVYDQWWDLASQPSKALKVFPSFISSLERPDILWNPSHYSSEIKNWLIQDISDILRSQAPLYPKVVKVYCLITIVPFSERFFPFVIERWLQHPQDHAFPLKTQTKKAHQSPFQKLWEIFQGISMALVWSHVYL